jgi:hypothetical protein
VFWPLPPKLPLPSLNVISMSFSVKFAPLVVGRRAGHDKWLIG